MPKRRLRILPYNGAKDYKFYIDGLKVGGKRKRIFFHTEKEALAELKVRERQLREEGEQGAAVSAEIRVEAAHAHARLMPFGRSIRDAVDFFIKHLEQCSDSAPLATVADGYYQAKEREGLSQKHLGDLRRMLGRFVASFDGRQIKTLTVSEIEGWLAGLELAPQSVNNYQAVLSAFFAHSLKRELITKNPAAAIPKIKLVDKAPEIFTPAQLAELLEAAPADLLPTLAIGAFAGVRNAEIMRLAWSEVDLARGYIEITARKSKTAARRLIPIASNLAEWLRPYAGSSGLIWPKRSWTYNYAITKLLQHTPNVHTWPANGLRHSFASYHLAEHQDAARLALAMGHTTTALIFSAYRELVSPEQAHAYWRISPSRPQNVVAMGKAGV
jgi:integrase